MRQERRMHPRKGVIDKNKPSVPHLSEAEREARLAQLDEVRTDQILDLRTAGSELFKETRLPREVELYLVGALNPSLETAVVDEINDEGLTEKERAAVREERKLAKIAREKARNIAKSRADGVVVKMVREKKKARKGRANGKKPRIDGIDNSFTPRANIVARVLDREAAIFDPHIDLPRHNEIADPSSGENLGGPHFGVGIDEPREPSPLGRAYFSDLRDAGK